MGCVNVMLNISPQNKTNMFNVNSWIQEDNYLILNKGYEEMWFFKLLNKMIENNINLDTQDYYYLPR